MTKRLGQSEFSRRVEQVSRRVGAVAAQTLNEKLSKPWSREDYTYSKDVTIETYSMKLFEVAESQEIAVKSVKAQEAAL